MNTPEQEASINALSNLGFYVNRNGDTCYMSKRVKHTTFYADVESDGSVSGQSLEDFIASFKAQKGR